MQNHKKIISRTAVRELADRLRREGQTIVFTNGCFDILHAGHVDLLEKARGFGDVLILGLNSDASVERLKGTGRPINSAEHRARVLLALSVVDYVSVFDEDTPFELIQAIRPDVLVKGADYTPDTIVGRDIVEQHGGRVEVVALLPGYSTSAMIRTIRQVGNGKRLDNETTVA